MARRSLAALAGFAALSLITAAWWALAFWPAGAGGELVQRAREVCFGTTGSGLPDAAGWLALVVQPTIMLGMFLVILGRPFEDAVRELTSRPAGRAVVGGYVVLVFAGLTMVGARVANASSLAADTATSVLNKGTGELVRLDRPAPRFRLVDQHGEELSLERFNGQTVLVTFAFGHCETVCPAVVHEAQAALRTLPDSGARLLVITLDPWRDLPSRLPHLAEQWELDSSALVASGPVAEVEQALDGWQVARARDVNTGDVVHPRLVYVVDGGGIIRYAVTGGVDRIVEAVLGADG